MEQEILSAIQRSQCAAICNDDLFTYEQVDAKQDEVCIINNYLVSTDYSSYLTLESIKIELSKPIKSFDYQNNLITLIYADGSGEILTLEGKVYQKFEDVTQILIYDDKIYTLGKDFTVKEYFFTNEQNVSKESLTDVMEGLSISKETGKILFQENKEIYLIIFKNTLFYFKDGNLFNKEQKKVTNSIKKVKELKNNKLLIMTEKNNKINLKITNIYFKLEEEIGIEEEINKVIGMSIFEEYFIIATHYKIYIFKDNLELIDLKEFNKKIKSFDVKNFRIKILFGEEKKKEKSKKTKKERYFNNQENFTLEEKGNSLRYQSEVLTNIVDKLVNTFTEERKEREEKERKRMESLLEKISEQLNLNLKLIIENSVKKEIQKISLKNLENSLCSFFKQFILENMVPIFENSVSEMKIQSKGCEKCSTNLYETFRRDEISKGVELALDSNEEIFDEFIKNFDTANLDAISINLVIELYKKTLLIQSDTVIPLRNKVFKRIKNQREFLTNLKEEVISLMPPNHLLKIISLIYNDNDFIDLLEELIKIIDITKLNEYEFKELSKIFDTLESGNKESRLVHFCIMQRNYMKRISKNNIQ